MFRKTACLSLVCCSAFVVAGPNLDHAAEAACQCMKEPYAKMEEVKAIVMQAMTSGDYSKITAMEGEFAGLQDRANACFEGLRKKYPDIDQSQQLKDEVTAMMQRQCPAPHMGFAPPAQ